MDACGIHVVSLVGVVDVGYSDLPHDPSHAFQPDTLDHPKHHHEKPYSHKNHLGCHCHGDCKEYLWPVCLIFHNEQEAEVKSRKYHHHRKHHKISS